jgi:7,8-dihydropterin-6-yl-methyl-4-(beta-D-ribofuranosyl)aminobenzene 5'-phosphate synthase
MNAMSVVDLAPVDAVEVSIVVDNFVDVLMAGDEGVRRFPLPMHFFEGEHLVAEHGYSALLTVERDGARTRILYDAGLSKDGLAHNLDVLEIGQLDLRAIVISHGHADHHGGLERLFRRHGRERLPLLIHPQAWRERRLVFPTGVEVRLPPPSRPDLEAEDVEVVEETGPSLLVDGSILVSGQVERTTAFETGFPIHEARGADGAWEPDPLILDDQNVIVHVRDLGLVVVSACSHAGAVNVLRHARRITGVDPLAGFVGGFHLTGGLFEPIIDPTVAAFAEMGVGRVVPGHCTGWRAVHALARRMPDAFIQPSVGTTFRFQAS